MRATILVVSRSADGSRAEIVVQNQGATVTRHVRLEKDGFYHWRQSSFVVVEGKKVETVHEVYKL